VSQIVSDFVAAATAGRPVYISEVRDRFARLSPDESFAIVASLRGFDNADHAFELVLPRFDGLSSAELALATEYFLACLYNIISTLGGRELELSSSGDRGEGRQLADAFEREFGISLARRDRPGYGRAVNVAERMVEAVSREGAASGDRFRVLKAESRRVDAGHRGGSVGRRVGAADIEAMCRSAVADLSGTVICGMDIGGTDIKICLAIDGAVTRFKEFDWFPAAFTTIDEIIEPILLLVRLMRLDAISAMSSGSSAALAALLEPAMRGDADLPVIADAVVRGEHLAAGECVFDAIGVCFPDVVVRDKIVGGEVYKTRGIRQNSAVDYETEFRRLSNLDAALRSFVKPNGAIGIVNDGPMAAFTAAVEMAAADPASVERGIFAHTLGTELGTGWVTEEGVIPDIPLEVYNCIIDLGSYPERAFGPDDVRSVNNFNTRLAGTLQKYTSQSGVFRLAMKYLPDANPALFAEILGRGFIGERANPAGFFVPTEPRDMRKPFLEFLMRLPERGGDPAVDQIFRELGEFLAVAWLETEWLLAPRAQERILFGRVVKHRACFSLMVEGARRIVPEISLVVADDELANTPLMRQLKEGGVYTVAQFAQAIGALHYANYCLHETGRAERGR
jgi:hypothetical protein